MAKKNIFKGIIWNRRYDGTWEVYDQYTGREYIVSYCCDGRWKIEGVPLRMSKPEIAENIIANRQATKPRLAV